MPFVPSDPVPASGATPPGEILVRFRPGAPRLAVESLHARARGAVRYRSDRTGWQAVALPPGADPAEALRRYAEDPAVEAAEFVRTRRLSKTPNDLLKSQWAYENTGQTIAICCRRLVCEPCPPGEGDFVARGVADADIDAPEAWDLATGSTSIVVAVLDTGIDPVREDLGDRVLPGYDFVHDDADASDDHGHGTAVASIIGAVGNNRTGMTGLNWAVTLLPVKVCDFRGACPESAILAGIDYAIDQGAAVVNMSLACDEHEDPTFGTCNASLPGSCFSQAEADAIERARLAGVVVVEAAGNCSGYMDDATTAYPCAYAHANNVCAGATDISDRRASFSNHGRLAVDIGAPGADILVYSPTARGGSFYWNGTSFASPMTAGVAALVLSRTRLTPEAVRERIVLGGDPVPLVRGLFEGGRLNARGALEGIFRPGVAVGADPPGAANLLADVNGDRRADLVRATGAGFEVSLNAGKKGFREAKVWSSAPLPPALLAADVDGNGRDDLVLVGPAGVEVLRAAKSSFRPPERWGDAPPGDWLSGDLNGDGRADLACRSSSLDVMISNGTGFEPAISWGSVLAGASTLLADVDGDGRADRLDVNASNGSLAVEASLSTGTGFGTRVPWLFALAGLDLAGSGDFDGDGREDLLGVERSSGCLKVIRSTGSAFEPPKAWSCPGPSDAILAGRADPKRDARADVLRHAAGGGWELLASSP